MKGYIKDFRKELQSDIWLMPPLYHRVWQFLKYMVNHKENKIPMEDGSFLILKPGQHLTSVRGIAQGVGYYEGAKWKEPNPRTISKILMWLEKQGMITIERGRGNRQYTLLTLSNWDSHQSENNEGNRKYTDSAEGRKQSVHINKNDKECIKNDKEVFSSSSTRDSNFSEVMNFYQSNLQRGLTESPFNLELLGKFYDENGHALLMAAMKTAAKAEAKGINFVEGVLKNWNEAGVKTIEDARKYELDFKANHKQKKSNVVPMGKRESQYDHHDYGF